MNCLRVSFWNANGIRQHKNELELFLIEQNIDVMLISETHLTARSIFKISGYIFYDTKDPRGRACGGSALLVKVRLKHHLLDEFCLDYLQATTICIVENNRNLVISSVYCPPRFTITENQFCDFYKSLGPRFLAAGDYNAKHTHWGSRLITPKGRMLFNAISKQNLSVISSGRPTYWPSDRQKIPDVIDFGVAKNIPSDFICVEASLELSSDHTPTILTICNPMETDFQNYLPARTHVNWLKFKKFLSSHCVENIPLRTPEDVDKALEDFDDHVRLAAKNATITTPIRSFSRIYSADVDKLLSDKRRIRREWQAHRSPQLKQRLKECTKQLRELLEERRTASLNKYLQDIDATPHTDYSLWRATKNIKRPTIRQPPLRDPSGDWAKSDIEKANLFSNHLLKVFTPNISSDIVELPLIVPIEAVPLRVEVEEMVGAIADLKPKKSPGIDKVSNKMILELPYIAVRILLFIFNAILRLSYYPHKWKTSLVIMIPKPGKDHTKVESYRPISLLPNISKLFEKLLINKLNPLLNERRCIPDHQFGFRRKHSTIEQTHRLVNVIKQCFENKEFCSALFIDVSQAFDKVWHEGLMHKIRQNLPQNISILLESYLTGRSFIVKHDDILSTPQPIKAGVPQGSILGPLLYLLYTSDMPTQAGVHISTFADDTALLCSHENSQEASRRLQDYVMILEKWLQKWRIKVNEQKCTHITFTLRRDTCPPITINNQFIPQHSEVKYLGMHLDRHLTWKHHIEAKLTQMKLKTVQLNWLIGRNSVLSLDCKLLIYKSILKPIWSYGIQMWGTASASNVEKIQRRQNKILRMLTAAPWYVKNSNIHKDLEMPYVKEEIQKHATTYLIKLESHPNILARTILEDRGHSRLKRRDIVAISRT